MIFVLIFAFVVVSGIATVYVMSLTKASVENVDIPLFSMRSGARIADNKIAHPFVRVSLYQNHLVISTYKKLVIPLDEIEGISTSRIKDEKGIEIKMRHPKNWPYVCISSKQNELFKSELLAALNN